MDEFIDRVVQSMNHLVDRLLKTTNTIVVKVAFVLTTPCCMMERVSNKNNVLAN